MSRYARSARDVTFGLDDRIFGGLSEGQHDVLIRLLARVAERSYRRGLQQGATMVLHPARATNLHDWRYGSSADLSPWADCAKIEPAVDRLAIETRHLSRLGLNVRKLEGKSLAAWQLIALTDDLRAARVNGEPDEERAVAAIRDLGRALAQDTAADAMATAYDDATEIAGAAGVQWVSGIWTGIGSWAA